MKNWLPRNVRSIVGIIVVCACLSVDISLLFISVKSKDLQLVNNIVTALHGALMFVLGYYYSANHAPPSTSITETKTETNAQ